jgi:uncharacterized protein YegP (UPF0339 family)
MTFEIFRRMTFRGRRYFWHLRARNHEIVCSGQSSGYANKGDVLRIIDKIGKIDVAQVKFLD